MDSTNTAMSQVDDLALPLVDNGKFATIQQARTHVFAMRPHLEEAVRKEQAVAAPVAKRVVTGTTATVEKAARALVADGTHKTMAQARAAIFVTQPKLAAEVRAEAALSM